MKLNHTARNSQGKKGNMWAFGQSPSRIETLTDGVFAIAMTILVLELSTDHGILASIAAVEGGSFMHLFEGIYAYVVGFLVLGVYWVLHHYMFHFIKRSNGVLAWLHVLFLMFAALVPLSTKVTRIYPDSYPAFLFYFATTVISILLLFAVWQYATRGYRLVDRDIDIQCISFVNKIIAVGVALMAVALVGAFFVSWMGYFGFVALIYVILATARGHHKPFFKRPPKST